MNNLQTHIKNYLEYCQYQNAGQKNDKSLPNRFTAIPYKNKSRQYNGYYYRYTGKFHRSTSSEIQAKNCKKKNCLCKSFIPLPRI